MPMILVDKTVIDLVPGFDRVRRAEEELLQRWRESLLAAYARRRELYEGELDELRQRMAEFLTRARVGMWLSSGLMVLGLLTFPILFLVSELGDLQGPLFCFGPLLILGGLNGWAVLGVMWLWQRSREKPRPPEHPLKSGLIEPLLPPWREGLKGRLPAEKPYEGATGEYHFIARLQALDNQTYILYQLQQKPGNDVDVTLVGPRGVWVFEVKYLKGTIRWRDGVWSHTKAYHGEGGVEVSESKEIGEAFDQQWKRMADDVVETIHRHAPEVLARVPKLARPRGGLVFTHPGSTYDIPPGSPFNWGLIQFWLDTLRKIPEIPGMDERAALEVLEALLARHRRVSGERAQRSMNTYAVKLVEAAEARLANWVQEV
jgi:hypothetical protein